jgi:putative heme-binding domain-containing protein
LFLVETLRSLPPRRLTIEQLQAFVDHPDVSVQRAATRSLALSGLEGREPLLQAIIADTSRDAEMRADAALGLADPREVEQDTVSKPNASDIDAWVGLLGQTKGDPNRGWRTFFGKSSGRCANCHTYQGRGADIGPDLTAAAKRLDRRRLIESILQPSREVAPRYVATNIETSEGRVLSGLSLGAGVDGETETFVASNGEQFTLPIAEIERRDFSQQSVMPDGLEQTMTIRQLADLLALFGFEE